MRQVHAYTYTMLSKSLKEAGEGTGQLELPYCYAGVTPGLNGWRLDRRGGIVHSTVRCGAGRRRLGAVLPLKHASEAAYIPGDLPDLRCRPTKERCA